MSGSLAQPPKHPPTRPFRLSAAAAGRRPCDRVVSSAGRQGRLRAAVEEAAGGEVEEAAEEEKAATMVGEEERREEEDEARTGPSKASTWGGPRG